MNEQKITNQAGSDCEAISRYKVAMKDVENLGLKFNLDDFGKRITVEGKQAIYYFDSLGELQIFLFGMKEGLKENNHDQNTTR